MKSLSKEQDLILSTHFKLHSSNQPHQEINISHSQDILNHISNNPKWMYIISENEQETWHNKYLKISIILDHDDTVYIAKDLSYSS